MHIVPQGVAMQPSEEALAGLVSGFFKGGG